MILTRDDFNGILPSPHVRGNLSIQGTVRCRNVAGYPVSVASGAPAKHDDWMGTGGTDESMEKYVCSIVGIYSNNYMSLDAKSGMVGEYSFAEQMGAQLRLQ